MRKLSLCLGIIIIMEEIMEVMAMILGIILERIMDLMTEIHLAVSNFRVLRPIRTEITIVLGIIQELLETVECGIIVLMANLLSSRPTRMQRTMGRTRLCFKHHRGRAVWVTATAGRPSILIGKCNGIRSGGRGRIEKVVDDDGEDSTGDSVE